VRLTFDDYILDVARRELWRGCEPVVVEPQVFDLLVYLAQHPERVVTKDELLQAVWDGRIVSESAITNRVNAARRAIGDSGEQQRLIRTVPRKGFRFIGAIKKEAAESTKEAVPQGSRRRQRIAVAFTAAVSGLLGGAIAAFLLWPAHPWVSAIGMHSGRMSTTASAGDLRPPIAVLPLTALGNSTDQPNLAASLTEDLTTDLSRGGGLLVTSRVTTSHIWVGRSMPCRLGASWVCVTSSMGALSRRAAKFGLPCDSPMPKPAHISGRIVTIARPAMRWIWRTRSSGGS
jgi:DNA-binding winged helix-turn-helix (wHTH) protein